MTVPDIVLVTIDSLRADKCGYTGGKELTPTLDAMAEDGVSFTNAIAPGNKTYESMPAIWTGELMHPKPDSLEGDDMPGQKEVNMRTETIPEMLSRRGYTCKAFTSNPHTNRSSLFSRGFDEYEDFLSESNGSLAEAFTNHPALHKLVHIYRTLTAKRVARPVESFYDEAMAWFESAPSPTFLWLFVLEPHTPYLPSKQYRSGSTPSMVFENARLTLKDSPIVSPNADRLDAWYEDTIRETDDFLASLRADTSDETTILVHSDHGEAFGPRDHGEFGHESHLFEENIHVPLVVDTPDHSVTVDDPVSLTEIPEMLRSIADGTFEIPESDIALSRLFDPDRLAGRTADHKYIVQIDEDHSIGGLEVYDLETDPEESELCPGAEVNFTELKPLLCHVSHEREVIRLQEAVYGHIVCEDLEGHKV
ncbi:sulfatase-like hydrolase/transferase [Halapricum sp. CBA1109]|uniref:sulfatase-like hydrolase/transferase n=1 Tax=Halapricum sp. CBA1109 TaxID=2668068 RepID=UPI0012F7A945|nr:sulfatase-like hydrolase/transferase [Halapricum sp. CBA1109]MUV88594.1 sulfatase-like hydrolase/transferase [Halapricum sp. CBA1109]